LALPELTKKRVESLLADFCEKRVPAHVRNQIKLTFEFRGDTATLFEDRPVWNDPSRWAHSAVAQFRIDSETLKWTLYCRDRNSKWHLYQGINATAALEELLAEVDRDPTGIFWG
jgi:hypothetical protein